MNNKIIYFSNVLSSASPFLIYDILSKQSNNKITLYILEDDIILNQIKNIFTFLNIESLLFPAYDVKEYDFISPSNAVIFERFKTLFHLTQYDQKKNLIILTTIKAIARKVHSKNKIKKSVLKLHINQNIHRDSIISYLNINGYIETTTAFSTGDFAIRGNIIDISLPNCSVRIDFFGNQIENIKIFDVTTQKSLKNISEITIFPVAEIEKNYNESLNDYPFSKFRMQGIRYSGEENWISTFYDDLISIFDYIPIHSNIIFFTKKSITEELDRIEKIFVSSYKEEYRYKEIDTIFINENEFNIKIKKYDLFYFSNFTLLAKIENDNQVENSCYNKIVIDKANILEFITQKCNKFKTIIICASSIGALSIINKIFKCDLKIFSNINECNSLCCTILTLENSFYKNDELLMIDAHSILGKQEINQNSTIELNDTFEISDYVVHKNHGVAKFDGLVQININNNIHECIKLVYYGGDILFVPVENINIISKYSKDETVELDKLGGLSWQLKKEHVRKHIQLISDELIKMAAVRKISTGEIIDNSGSDYIKFCEKFPYVLTEDQKNAINSVEHDLKSGKVMDRLISGDTGFGKTEVLLRAAFLSVNQNKEFQVAVITPTGILCAQHFKIFEERFEGFEYNIKQISKKISKKSIEEIKQNLSIGKINIIIGTHAVIKYSFKKLVLIIIDEEHCFGVKQKEELKKLGNNVHILTLSATPIPRTLQMSLSGIKNLSNIKTPPFERILPKVFIMEFDNIILKEAIIREYKRGGKIFCVVPKISQMNDVLKKLNSILPEEILIKITHGQMKEQDIEKTMNDFYENKFSVLLTTTIIQAGIDIPTANTIIVLNAEMFGMATLYQLRGRVGRGKVTSFVYFVVENYTENSRKRLQNIASINNLGSGLEIAAHDMDIRGFGNLIGEKQSGKIKDVGIELYQKMLSDAMSSKPLIEDVRINIPLSAGIPIDYIKDFKIRLQIYNTFPKLCNITAINRFTAEIIDRFGHPLPQELQNLIQIVELQYLCTKINIKQIDISKNIITITFDLKNCFNINSEIIFNKILKIPNIYIKATDKITLKRTFSDYNAALNIAIKEVNNLCSNVFAVA